MWGNNSSFTRDKLLVLHYTYKNIMDIFYVLFKITETNQVNYHIDASLEAPTKIVYAQM